MKYWKLQFGKSSGPEAVEKKKIDTKSTLTLTENDSTYRIADCCNPIPGDDILGFVEDDGKVVVHKRQCPVAMKLKSNYGERIVSAVWETHRMLCFPATIEIRGIDRKGMLGQIVKVISDEHSVNVNKVNMETKDGIFEGFITIYVHDLEDLNNLSMNLLKINGVNSVNRVELSMNSEH